MLLWSDPSFSRKYEATDDQGKLTKPDQKLLASEWSQRFPASDNRSQLTWRNRLAGVVSTLNGPRVLNFYSSTEEVLRAYPEDDLVHIRDLLSNPKKFVADLATSAWVKQEKFKGRRSFFNMIDGIGGVSSPFAGWSFNQDWDVENGTSGGEPVMMHLPPAQAALIDKDEFKTKPFFDPPMIRWFGADLAELVSPNGSAFVDKNVNEDPGLDKYYTGNNAAHTKVKIKDWLLAEAFPATTLPMGANKNGKIDDVQQIDMSGVKDNNGGCCKTSEGLWPRNERYLDQKEWRHSDYKDIAFQHVYGFYRNIQQLSER